jgi:oligoribonuclease (3'-5' exoribonuclease)
MPKKPTSPDQSPLLLLLDCATTGLNAETCTILEVAAILVDATTLDVIDTNSWVIRHEAAAVKGAPDFHGDLVLECVQGEHAVSMARCEGELIAGMWLKASAVCNRAIYFDRPFFTRYMPNAARYISKSEIDINGLEILARARGGRPLYVSDVPRTYRATDDVIAAYEALVHYTTNAIPESK